MFAFDPSQKMMGHIQVAGSGAAAVQTDDSGGEDFFHRLLDVVNPLQHLPVVSTIYRAMTGEHIGPLEKLAGDALYGGLWGAVSSAADLAFEAATGKSAEDTVLGWFHHDASVGVADVKVSAPHMAVNAPLPSADMPALPMDTGGQLPDSLQMAALTSALAAKGVDTDTAGRALYAYRRSMDLSAPRIPIVASLN
jgi:hypothetical protein